MTRQDDAAFAAEVVDAAIAAGGVAPRVYSGEVMSSTDTNGDVELRLDGPELPVGALGGEAGDLADDEVLDDIDDSNAPVHAKVVGDPPSRGQRVLVLAPPGGAMYAIGSLGGAWRILGGAIVDNHDNVVDDDDTWAASSAEEELAALSCVVEIPYVRRWVEATVQARLGATVGGTAGTGRIYAEDENGTSFDIGRWATGLLRPASSTGTLCSGSGVMLLDPGIYRIYATATVPDGFTVLYPTSRTAAFVKVTDEGPIPEGVSWPDDG